MLFPGGNVGSNLLLGVSLLPLNQAVHNTTNEAFPAYKLHIIFNEKLSKHSFMTVRIHLPWHLGKKLLFPITSKLGKSTLYQINKLEKASSNKNKFFNPNSLDKKGSCWILKDFYCSVTMLRELGLKYQQLGQKYFCGRLILSALHQVNFFLQFD